MKKIISFSVLVKEEKSGELIEDCYPKFEAMKFALEVGDKLFEMWSFGSTLELDFIGCSWMRGDSKSLLLRLLLDIRLPSSWAFLQKNIKAEFVFDRNLPLLRVHSVERIFGKQINFEVELTDESQLVQAIFRALASLFGLYISSHLDTCHNKAIGIGEMINREAKKIQ